MEDNRQSRNVRGAPTVVRGVLFLGEGHDQNPHGDFGSCPKPVLLDISGRKALDLTAGANDVSRLAPGVYLVRGAAPVGRKASSAIKVVIAR